MTEYWDFEMETMMPERIKVLQLQLLNQQLQRARHAPAYRGKLPERISSLDAMKQLPFTDKGTLRENFPYGFLATRQENIVHFHLSSGSTGIPTVAFFSKNDLKRLVQNEARCFYMAGLRSHHTFQIMAGIGLCTAGWTAYRGATEIGASVLPVGPGNTRRQIALLQQFNVDFCFATPGYLQHLLSVINQNNAQKIRLSKAITGGEPLPKYFQKLAQEKYHIEVFNFYGMTETGSHIATECPYHSGLHISEDQFYCEIVDPDTGEAVPDGEYGELVITPLQREAMPLIRYRTRDITRFISGECPCGRTHRRIEPITHRIDDMMIINGVNVYPSQIEECIYQSLPAATNWQIHVQEQDGLKKIRLDIELPDEWLHNPAYLDPLKQQMMSNLKASITVSPMLNFIPRGTLPEIQGKAKRVIKDTE